MSGSVPVMLGLDQGTGSSRAILVDAAGRVHGLGSAPVLRTLLPSGFIDQSAEACLRSLRLAVRRAFASGRVLPRAVQGIGLACQRSTSVAFQRGTLRALAPAISWQCQRTRAWLETLAPAARRTLARRTGLPVVPHYAASKLRWLRDRLPRRAGKDVVLGTLDSFLVARLTAAREPLTDLSQAQRTLLVALSHRDWSPEHLRLFGLARAQLPRIVPTMGELGRLRAGALVPVPRGVPFLALAGDQQAALFGSGMRRRGEAKVTFGSGAFLLAPAGPEAPRTAPRLLRSVAWSDAGAVQYLLEFNVPSAGTVLDWLARLTGASVDALLRADASRGPLAERLGGVLFLPALAGIGPLAPDLLPGGRIDGLTHDVDGPRLATAAAAGIGAALAEGREALEHSLGRRLRKLVADGGGSRDPVFARIQCDLLERPLTLSEEPECTAFGAAALAWQAASGTAPRVPLRPQPLRSRLAPATVRQFRRRWGSALEWLAREQEAARR